MEVLIILMILPLLAGATNDKADTKNPATLALGVIILFLVCALFAVAFMSQKH